MNVFWKLFVTLGIAMTVALIAAVSLGWQIGQLTVAQIFEFDEREAILERASQALNRGGRSELTNWLRQNQSPVPGLMLLVIDETSEDLLGREIPREWRRLLRWSSENRNRYGVYGADRNRRDRQITDDLIAPTGEVFRFLIVPTEITLLNILALPTTQVGVVAIAIIMAALTSLLLARSFSSPIARLQRATRALAAGALETRVGSPFNQRKDEVGTLARDFDSMAGQMQALITDKETLLRDVSHELRSPLARIRVALALAQRKANDPAQPDLERIEQETERLDHLVGQILTLARLRTAAPEHPDEVDLEQLLRDVIDDAKFEHPEAEIGFDASPVPTVRGSCDELASAIENVLRNALIHAGENHQVQVSLAAVRGNAVIKIADDGPGVPDDQLKRLFEPFYRVDASRDHQQSGYGLGLAIASRIVEKHGGTITAANRPAGGLEICFELPASRVG
ncbi:MAG: ATP-binding protein [Gammaproteobacteria bacterium]|nr:ATP-binding protein [Gammaproteobacteria bacterium]